MAEEGTSHYAQIRLWLSALSHVVSRLERIHSAIVEAIVAFPWTTMDATSVKSYIHFIGMLLSARPEYLSLVLGNIAQGFTYRGSLMASVMLSSLITLIPESGLQTLEAGLPEGSSTPLTRRIIYDRLHTLLRHIYSLIPTLPSTLQPLLVQNFPHKRQNQAAQTTYIRNLLRVTEILPELADIILATIIERAIQMDVSFSSSMFIRLENRRIPRQVEIQVELEELEEDDTEQTEEVFEIDPFDAVLGQEEVNSSSEGDQSDIEDGELSDLSDIEDDEEGVDIPTNLQHIRDMVKKLDAILKLVFDHLDRNQTPDVHSPLKPCFPILSPPDTSSHPMDNVDQPPFSAPSLESRRATQFNVLLSIFERTILCTFKSRYTQFLIFWYSSLDSEFCDIFQGMLVSKALLEQSLPMVTRAAAASYLASFVSRAQFVDRDGARRVMGVLCDFLRDRLDVFDSDSRSGITPLNIAHYSVFYAVSQAVFLIFCFRWRDMLEIGDDDTDELSGGMRMRKKWMSSLDVVQRLITCPLNPLKVRHPLPIYHQIASLTV